MITDLPMIKCPKCKQMTLEIHGEGISNTGYHYPLEQCVNCDFLPTNFDDKEL